MSTTTEVALGFAWIYATLSADSTLSGYAPGGVSRTFAQPNSATPYVIMRYQSGRDTPVFGGGRAYSELRFEIVVVGAAKSMQALVSAATRIETLLTVTAQTTVTGGVILASYRDQPISDDVLVDGEVWTTTGGVYCVLAKAS